jgi:dTDP-glucose 4,6-dehydratase
LLFSSETDPVNIGNSEEMTVLEFAQTVLEVTGSGSEITFVRPTDARTADDPQVRSPDISKARRVLGWSPEVPLEVGLRLTAAYFQERL